MSRVWFTSDLHFGHELVARDRGFSSPMLHDLAVVANWENTVGPKDQVWVLGDVTVSKLDYALDLVQSLPGKKHLIAGNHDSVHPMHRNAHKQLRRYLSAFESVSTAARRRMNGQDVLLSHFPYRGDRGETRHSQWRLKDEGLPLIHGHTHSKTLSAQMIKPPGPLEIHVGLDAWHLRPVPLESVLSLLKGTQLP